MPILEQEGWVRPPIAAAGEWKAAFDDLMGEAEALLEFMHFFSSEHAIEHSNELDRFRKRRDRLVRKFG